MKLPLKKMRESKGITQLEFSKLMNVAPSTIGMWEQNRREPDYETLKRIADYFDVSADYLLGREKKVSPAQDETTLIEKYRRLTDEGKKSIMIIMNQMVKPPMGAAV